MANQRFGDQLARLASEAAGLSSGPPGRNPVHEVSLLDLVAQMARGPQLETARMAIFLRMTGLAALSGAVVLLARSLARRVRFQSFLWLVAVPGIYVVLMVLAKLPRQAGSHLRPFGDGLELWALAGWAVVASMALWRNTGPGDVPVAPPA